MRSAACRASSRLGGSADNHSKTRLPVSDYGRERLIHLMSDGSGELAHREHARKTREFRLGPQQCAIGGAQLAGALGNAKLKQVARLAERPFAAFFRGAYPACDESAEDERSEIGAFGGVNVKRVVRNNKEIVDDRRGNDHRQQTRCRAAKPRTDHYRGEKQEGERIREQAAQQKRRDGRGSDEEHDQSQVPNLRAARVR